MAVVVVKIHCIYTSKRFYLHGLNYALGHNNFLLIIIIAGWPLGGV